MLFITLHQQDIDIVRSMIRIMLSLSHLQSNEWLRCNLGKQSFPSHIPHFFEF